MAPLKALEREYPVLDSDFQSFCASHGIFTVEDFLMHDVYEFASLADHHPNSESLKEGVTQVLSVIDGLHQPWLRGMELLEDALQNKHVLSTGFHGIDLLLQGGLRQGQLAELAGPSSSGKTQVCLRAASIVACKHMGQVVYMDSSNSFSPKRIEQIVSQIPSSVFYQAGDNILQKVMSNIICHSVFDISVIFDMLHKMEMNFRSQVHSRGCKVKLIIIDSISSLIAPVLGGSGSQGHSLMTSAGLSLKKLAYEHDIAVLVTNHMVAGEGGNPKPALGESWKSIPHVRLLLSRDSGSNICNMSLLKHPSVAPGAASTFKMDE